MTQTVSEAMSAVVGLGASAAKAATGRSARESAVKVANASFLFIAEHRTKRTVQPATCQPDE
jgi:hypothetical protein